MNKIFLTSLLLGVSYTAYNAAAVSENFAISTIIDHEIVLGNFKSSASDVGVNVSLGVDFGTIVIDSTKNGYVEVDYENGRPIIYGDVIVEADSPQNGYFSANIPNPSACNGNTLPCGGLSILECSFINGGGCIIPGMMGNTNTDCTVRIKYSGAGSQFIMQPDSCIAVRASDLVIGTHNKNITISYAPES
ncbi:MAG: hypothetical protein IJ689_07340 [Alphaproteobacteria bacterium]|nr:hypothetical protein [Alphaproteobacteria bacterium]